MTQSPTEDILSWLRAYAAERIHSRLIDERRCIPPYVVLDLGNRGILGAQVPRAYGGLELSTVDALRIAQQLGAIDITIAIFVGIHNFLGIRPIQKFAREDLKEELLPRLASGRELAGLAITEDAAGSNPRGMRSIATPEDGGAGGFRLNGEKVWIGNAGWASVLNVFARCADASNPAAGLLGCVVRQGTPGFRVGEEALTMGVRGIVQNRIHMKDVRVPARDVLGRAGDGFLVAEDSFSFARLGLAAIAVGAMRRSAQLIFRYASRREISTGSLLENPVTLAKMSHVVHALEGVDAVVELVARAVDAKADPPADFFVACKVLGPEYLWSSVDTLVQILGGRGYIEPNIAPQFLRDARLLRIFEGPTETMLSHLGALVLHEVSTLPSYLESLALADLSERLAAARSAIKAAKGHVSLQYMRMGDVAARVIMLAALRHRGEKRPQTDAAIAWAEDEVAHAIARGAGAHPTFTLKAAALKDTISEFRHVVGDIEEGMAGEDHDLDGMLRTGA